MELHHMTVHYKGRLMLALMINDPNNGLDFSLRRMYAIVLQAAPIQEWARWN